MRFRFDLLAHAGLIEHSTANHLQRDIIFSATSLTYYIKNNRGPRTEHFGTPACTRSQLIFAYKVG